jgi:hypothetical protein
MPADQCLELLGDSAETEAEVEAEQEDMLAAFSAGAR